MCWQLLLLATLLAPAATAQAPDAPVFSVHTAGTSFPGTLRSLADDFSVRVGGRKPAVVAGSELIGLRRHGQHLPAYPRHHAVVLTNGDRLLFDPEAPFKLADDHLHFMLVPPLRPVKAKPVVIPLNYVAVLWLVPPQGSDDPESALRQLQRGKRAGDVLLLRNGDQLEGAITALDRDKGCRIRVQDKEVDVPLTRLAAVGFNPELQSRLSGRSAYAHVIVADGSRVGLTSARLAPGADTLVGKTLFGTWLEVPLEQVLALDIRQGCAVYLSDLKPRHYEHTPFLGGSSWPLAADAGLTGGELRLGGNVHDKGLSMHARSQVTYHLGGAYEGFETVVGLDERSGRRGRARIRVLVDGKAHDLGLNRELTAADGASAVRIPVGAAQQLTLVVDFGTFGDVQAHINWADARLIKKR
jgi:hypothetical protein